MLPLMYVLYDDQIKIIDIHYFSNISELLMFLYLKLLLFLYPEKSQNSFPLSEIYSILSLTIVIVLLELPGERDHIVFIF